MEHRLLVSDDLSTLTGIRRAYGEQCHGLVERDDLGWRLRIFNEFSEDPGGRWMVLHRTERNGPDGYACYSRILDGSLVVHEIITLHRHALKALLSCLAAEADAAPLTLITRSDCPMLACASAPLDLTVEGHACLQAMHRIVDVQLAFESRRLVDSRASGCCVLHVRDDTCPWNCGAWLIQLVEGSIVCEPATGVPADAAFDISVLARLYLGSLTLPTAVRTGEIVVERRAVLPILNSLFAAVSPPFSGDHF